MAYQINESAQANYTSAALGGKMDYQQNACIDRKPTPLELVRERIETASNHAAGLAEQLSILEGRLMGGGNGEGKCSPPRPTPTGFVGQSNMALDELFSRLDACAQTARRLMDAI